MGLLMSPSCPCKAALLVALQGMHALMSILSRWQLISRISGLDCLGPAMAPKSGLDCSSKTNGLSLAKGPRQGSWSILFFQLVLCITLLGVGPVGPGKVHRCWTVQG